MKLALCDDDLDFLAQTERTLRQQLDERSIAGEIFSFLSAEALMMARGEGMVFDIYLLDIMLPGVDGIALGHRIREQQPKAPIVYFTTSREFALESYGVEAADYVVKPFTSEEFARALDRAFNRLPPAGPTDLVFSCTDGVCRISFKEILAIETAGHYQVVETTDGMSHVVRLGMQELWDKLKHDNRFARVGRQLIINLAQVTSFNQGTLVTSVGRSFPVPRRNLGDVRNAFMRFYS